MARKYEVTNLSRGPRGFHTVDRGEVVIPRHASEVITVESNTEEMLLAMAKKGEVEVSDLGAVDPLDHDRDGKKGGAAPALKLPASAVDAKTDDLGAKLAEANARADAAEAEVERLKKVAETEDEEGQNAFDEALDAMKAERDAALAEVETLKADVERLTALIGDADDEALEGREPAPGGTDGADGPAAPAETIENAGPAEYAPSLAFETLGDDALRAFIKQATGKDVHPQTKTPKLVEKALAADRAQWDEAQKALAAGGAPAQPENDEAV